jgi:ATP-dependent helicase/nuclease subunit A
MNLSLFPHEVISASAGSGKTFQLANRFIALMANGVAPSRIVGLTFSRKAAGEILDKIIRRLAEAAASEEAAARLSLELREAGYPLPGGPEGGREGPGETRFRRQGAVAYADSISGCSDAAGRDGRFAAAGGYSQQAPRPGLSGASLSRSGVLGILRTLVESLHVTRLGTLDSFFVALIRCFPFELGIGGGFEVIDGPALARARVQAMQDVMRFPTPRSSGQSELLEQFKQATFGVEEKSFAGRFGAFIREYHQAFLEAPEFEAWGNPLRIWRGNPPWPLLKQAQVGKLAATLAEELEQAELTAAQSERWSGFIEAALACEPGAPLPKILDDVTEKLAAVLYSWKGEALAVSLARKLELTTRASAALVGLLRHVVGCVIVGQLRRTAGLYLLLRRYESSYHEVVRSRGRLAFADIQFLLSHGAGWAGAPEPFPGADRFEVGRLQVERRLDSSLDHWLLDEFQDTSGVQWMALRSLVEEVLQDASGRRSLFYVGDVKQAIYGWRGGDSRLFHGLLDTYGKEAGFRVRQLARSYRSAPPVIAAVNRVFGRLRELEELPEAVQRRWEQAWQEHETASTQSGSVELLTVARGGKGPMSEEGRLARFRICAQLLEDIGPGKRGLSVAVLLRSNKAGRELRALLADQGIESTWQGGFPITDAPPVKALLALVQAAAHPGDTQAVQYLRMTPMGALLLPAGTTTGPAPDELVLDVLADVTRHGFEHLVRKWTARFEGEGSLTPFSRRRLDQLASAAAEFDRSGEPDCDSFIESIAGYEAPDSDGGSGVTLMTMHKAKGLEFDLVLLPELEAKQGINKAGAVGLGISKAADVGRRADWVLSLPKKVYSEADPVLRQYLRTEEEESCYEQLCLLYVAMTRARRGLIMVTAEPAKSSGALYLSTVLQRLLPGGPARPWRIGREEAGLAYVHGDPHWWRG